MSAGSAGQLRGELAAHALEEIVRFLHDERIDVSVVGNVSVDGELETETAEDRRRRE